MSEMYRNSYLTLAANSNEASCEGLFHAKIDCVAGDFSVRIKQGRPKLYHIKEKFDWTASLERRPLQSRACCLQEREFVPKVMHWIDRQTLWECRIQKAYQDLSGSKVWMNTANDRRAWDLIASANQDEIFDLWHRTIERYTKRTLIFSTDTLSAIGGLAQPVNQRISSEYRAGMWADDLRPSLTWSSCRISGAEKTKRHRNKYIAPTWSWASLRGAINFLRYHHDDDNDVSMHDLDAGEYCEPINQDEGIAVIDDHSVRCSTTNIHGEVNGGELYITTSIVWVFFKHNLRYSMLSLKDRQEVGHIDWDDESEQQLYGHVACIFIVNHDRKGHRSGVGIGLALVPVAGQGHTYQRVGRISRLRRSRFASVPAEQIIIV